MEGTMEMAGRVGGSVRALLLDAGRNRPVRPCDLRGIGIDKMVCARTCAALPDSGSLHCRSDRSIRKSGRGNALSRTESEKGDGKMDNGITFLPNDRYLLENEKFRLYYTAAGDEAHNFIVVVEDNFSNSYELEFDFNNRNVKDDDLTIVPIGNFSPLLK